MFALIAILALALWPAIPLAYGIVRMQMKVEEFVKLLQVPVLKGDLNRVLKVCSVYSYPLSVATHGMVLQIKRPFGIDLAFQTGLAKLNEHDAGVARQASMARFVQLVVLIAAVWLNLRTSVPPWTPWAVLAIILGTEGARLPLRANLAQQSIGLYRLRALIYSNQDKMSEGDSNGGWVPVRYRPMVLSAAELEAYTARMAEFIAGYKARKDAGEPVLNANEEWDKADVAASPLVPEEPL